jgi:opacity protein-like surface antigen
MLIFKRIICVLSCAFTLTLSSYGYAGIAWQHPYIQVNVGGNAALAQSSHSNLFTYDNTGVLQDISSLYGRSQQENAFGPAVNLALGFSINQFLRTAISLSYFQSAQNVRSFITLSDLSAGGTSTTYYSASTWMGLVNLYLQLNPFFHSLSDTTQPYIGAGLGIANNRMGTQTTYYDGLGLQGASAANSSRNFAYKLMAGINYALLQHFLFNAEYAFVSAGSLTSARTGSTEGFTFYSSNPYEFQVYTNQITAGFVYEIA